ncbi:hypothetical protein [Sphingomonas oryzagri]
MDLSVNDENSVIAATGVEPFVHPKLIDGRVIFLLGNAELNFEIEMSRENAQILANGLNEALHPAHS